MVTTTETKPAKGKRNEQYFVSTIYVTNETRCYEYFLLMIYRF